MGEERESLARWCWYLAKKKPGTRRFFFYEATSINGHVLLTPTTLILVLSLSDGTTDARVVLLRTLSSALDPQRVHLKPRVLGTMPADVLTELSYTSPVVEVHWQDEHHCHVRTALRPGEWVEKKLSFSRRDPLPERAKVVAYTVAAMMPEWRPTEPRPVEHEQAFPDIPALSASDFTPLPNDITPVVTQPPPPAVTPPEPVVVEESRPPTEHAIASATQGFVGLSGLGTLPSFAAGPQLDVAVCPITWLCLGASANAAFGNLANSTITRFDVRVGGFAEGRVLPWQNQRLGFNARLGGGAQRQSAQQGGETQMRWVGIGSLEGGLLGKIGAFEVSLSFGAQWSGRTQVVIDNTQVTEITPINGFGRLGVALGWE